MSNNSQGGMTVIEVVVVMAIIGLSLGIAVMNLRPLESPLDTASSLAEGFLRQARTSAIATTSAHRVVVRSGTTKLEAEYAGACSDSTWTSSTMTQSMPTGVGVAPTDFSVCFSPRGLSDTNATLALSHPDHGSLTVEVMVGGTTRVVQ